MAEELEQQTPQEIHEEEVFEINDFTNASEWEKFIAHIDENIIEWQLNRYINLAPLKRNELTTGEWETKTASLWYSNVPFTLTLHQLKQKENEHFEEFNNDEDEFELPLYGRDAMDMTNDFPARAHCLSRWFGLRSFLIIKPEVPIQSLSKTSLLLSSIAVSLSNTLCSIPMFVQIQEFWRRMYAGHATSPGMQTQYDMVHLKKCPVQHAHLSGLLHLLKGKIGLTSLSSSSCKVATRFTYVLSDWGSGGKWPSKLPNPEIFARNFSNLVTGCLEDPVGELHLATTWPYRTGDMIIDNDLHSDYDPLKAPGWSIRLLYVDDVTCFLSYYLFEFIKSAERKETLSDLLHFQEKEQDKGIGQALSRLTDPQANTVIPIIPSKLASGISKVVSNPQNFLRRGAFAVSRNLMGVERIKAQDLKEIMKFIFSESTEQSDTPAETAVLHQKLKAAPVHSITHRLAIAAMVVNLCHGGIWSIALLWHAFVTELRRRLDSAEGLPALEASNPDLKTCLLHQKLQMLNCCISRKSERERKRSRNGNEIEKEEEMQTEEYLPKSVEPENAESTETELNTKANGMNQIESETSDQMDTASYPPQKSQEEGDFADESAVTSTSDSKEGTTKRSKIPSFQSDSDDDDEFFECESADEMSLEEEDVDAPVEEEQTDTTETPTITQSIASENADKALNVVSKDKTAALSEAAGRLEPCGELKLLYEDRPLFVPVTQEHAPQTEDTLEEQAEVFSRLGDTQEGSQVRAKMQSTSLMSDMEAFKAANPGCVLEDFVRWYSPRDFEEGCLSPRMRIPGNLWVVTWSSARPIAAHRQKRIFDDTKEAEKVLHFLTNLRPAEILQLLLPVCIQEIVLILKATSAGMSKCLPSLPLICSQIESRASQVFKGWKMSSSVANQFVPWSKDDRSRIDDLLRQVSFAENLVERARSLRHKFSGVGDETAVNAFVKSLLEHPEMDLDGGANGRQGKLIKEYFFSQQAAAQREAQAGLGEESSAVKMPSLPSPAGREFIIRAMVNSPSSFSHQVPHRLYAVLMQSEFRLACSISSDTTFF